MVEERPELAKAEPSFSEATDDQASEDRRSGERRVQQEDRRKHPRTDPDRRQGDRRGSEQEQSRDAVQAVESPASQPALSRPTQVSASPAVRKRARDLGVDLAKVRSAGGDRIRHSDLDAYLLYNGGAVSHRSEAREDEQIKVVGLRRKIADNMQEAKRRIPHFSYVEEVDVTALEGTRAMMNGDRGDNPRLTLLPFLITAICRAVPKFPQVNARYDDETNILTRHGAVHLGVAAQTDSGLMVPVIRDAQDRDIWGLAAEVQRLADATRGASATRDELSGSTITISSLGPMGGIVSTPVINRPEVGIIAVNKVLERPTVIDGRIEIRKMMNLSSSFDHRVVDGWDAASFIQEVKRLLEHPLLLLSLR
jgi:2-oxoisovalerate dehydrogenase E2 component (dihydrolipoyl transacylase)